jgi:hypothetical protein
VSTLGKNWKWNKDKLARHRCAGKYFGIDHRIVLFFRWARWRAKKGKCPSFFWPQTRDGVLAFLAELGPIPDGMIRPSVGRRDHSKGYEPGNVQWEEFNHNSRKRFANQDRFKKIDEELERLKTEIPF